MGTTNVGDFDTIPAEPHRTIDAEVGLAYDRSGGPYTGRVYMVYTDETPDETNNTDVYLRYSDNDGQTWSNPVRVNDDTGTNSQFFPRMAVDPTTGTVGVSWYDARNDLGVLHQGSRDAVANNDVEFYAAVGTPAAGGVDFSPNVRVTPGVSNASSGTNLNDFGDYTGLAFFGGVLRPAWADNSNLTRDNPDADGGNFDLYTAALPVDTTPAPVLGGPVPRLVAKSTAGRGKSYSFDVVYTDPGLPIDPATLDGNDVLLTGPNGFATTAQLRKVKRKRGVVTATYRFAPPGGPRAAGPGVYTISLQENQVADAAGRFAAARTLFGTFLV